MIKTILRKSLAGLLASLLSCPAGLTGALWAAEAPASKISLDALEIGDDKVELKLSGAAKYNSFLIEKPSPRLVLELLDTEYNLGAKSVAGKGKMLQRVRSGQFAPAPNLSTRVVFDLSGAAKYKISSDKNLITVTLSPASVSPAPVEASAAAPKPEPAAAPAPSPAPVKVAIKPKAAAAAPDLGNQKGLPGPLPRTRAGKKKAAPAAVPAPKPTEASAPVAAAAPQDSPGMKMEAAPASVAPAKPAIKPKAAPAVPAPKPTEASAPIAAADEPPPQPSAAPAKAKPAPAPKAGSMSTEMSSELAQMAEQVDVAKSVNDAVAAPPKASAHKPAVPLHGVPACEARKGSPCWPADLVSRLPRDLVTLDFDNTDIRDVLKLVQAKAGFNVVVGPDVTGNITLHLVDVPFNEAYRTIMTMMNLTSSQIGDNILRIMTPAALAKERAGQVGITKILVLNYTKPAAIMSQITSVASAEGRNTKVLADANINAVIVTDTPEGIAAAERIVAQLDIKPRQVMIETKVVEVSLNRAFSIGVQWSFFEADRGKALGKQGTTLLGGPALPAATDAATGQPFDGNTVAPPSGLAPFGTASGAPPFGVSVPSALGGLGALTLGRVVNNFALNATLAAMATQGKLKVLSDPKVATMNNVPATITTQSNVPYATTNITPQGGQNVSITYVNIGITLSVTPTINADNTVTLVLSPNVTQPGGGSSVSGAPPTDTRSVTTTLIAKDGETLVIGGLITDSMENATQKVPFFGDLPLIGWLFKNKKLVRSRRELLIFVTPKIMPD